MKHRTVWVWLAVVPLTLYLSACGGDSAQPSSQVQNPVGGNTGSSGTDGSNGGSGNSDGDPSSPSTENSLTWSQGALLEDSGLPVQTFANVSSVSAGMADDGYLIVTFLQTDAEGRTTLQSRSGVPSSSTNIAAMGLGPAVILDGLAPIDPSTYPTLQVTANGNALVTWKSLQSCGADSYSQYVGPGTSCTYIYSSRYIRANGGGWESSRKVASTQDLDAYGGRHIASINDNGDVAILHLDAKTPTMSITYARNGETSFQTTNFPRHALGSVLRIGKEVRMALDASGTINIVGEMVNASSSRDIVHYEGSVVNGFVSTDPTRRLESLSSRAYLQEVGFGKDGDIVAAWTQDTPTRTTATLLSIYSPALHSWTTDDLTPAAGSLPGIRYFRLADGGKGDAILYFDCYRLDRRNGTWQNLVGRMPNCTNNQNLTTVDRQGNYVTVYATSILSSYSTGAWSYYDAISGVMKKTAPTTASTDGRDYVLGVNASPQYSLDDNMALALSKNGSAALVVASRYILLPMKSAPYGDYYLASRNLWGFLLK